MSNEQNKDESGKLPDGSVPPPVTPKGKGAKANGEDPTPLPTTDLPPEDDDANDSAPEIASPSKPKEEIILPGVTGPMAPASASIAKPAGFSLESFRSKKSVALSNVATLAAGLPHYKLSAAKDFVRLHPDEVNFWSDELCFINVTIQGQSKDTLHLINEDLALRYLEPSQILRFRLALATKPYDRFFLCHVPSQRLDNAWNELSLAGCIQAKTLWTEAASLRDTGLDRYRLKSAQDAGAFPEPTWPEQTLEQLIWLSFADFMILRPDHPALLRKIGAKQSLT